MSPKICVLAYMIPPHYGGAGRLAVYYSRNIARTGREVELLTCIPNPDPVEEVHVEVFELPSWYALQGGDGLWGGIRRKLYDPIIILRLRRYFRDHNIDVVHCLAAKWFSLLAIIAARFANVSSIVETTLLNSDDALALKKRKLGWLQFAMFRKADLIVNQSPSLQQACLQAGLGPEQNVIVVNPANVHNFHPVNQTEKHELRKRFGLDGFKHVLITVGVVRPRKNTADIVSMFLELANLVTDCCLVIIGPHDKDDDSKIYSSKLVAQIETKDMLHRVIFVGEVKNVQEWMQAADIFLFASLSEGLPLVMPEALSSGLPIVSTPIQDIARFVVKHGETGYVVDNMIDGVSLVSNLLQNSEKLRKFSKAARQDATDRFSEEVVMEQYFELYSHLASQRN